MKIFACKIFPSCSTFSTAILNKDMFIVSDIFKHQLGVIMSLDSEMCDQPSKSILLWA